MDRETAPYVHPLYEAMRLDWIFYRLAYEGGRRFITRYLSQHENERAVYYERRAERAVYPNIIASVVDTYTAHVFHEPVARGGGSGFDSAWHDDLDLRGTGADQFYAETLTHCLNYGACGVLTDRYEPDTGQTPITRQQERELGRRPYRVNLAPPDIIDWETDRFGRILWLIHRDECDDPRDPMAPHEHGAASDRFKLWTPTSWAKLEVRVEGEGKEATRQFVTVEEGEHPVGRVPVQFVFYGRRTGVHPHGESAIKDLAPAARRIMNLISLIDEQAFQHVFNVLCVPKASFEALRKQNFSTAGCLEYEEEQGRPFYLAPDVSQLTVLREELDATLSEIRVLSGLGRQNEGSNAPVSGRSMAFQTMDKVALMERLAERLAALEWEVDADGLAWMELAGEPEPAVYDTDFDPEAVSDQLEEALMFDSFGIGGQAKVETYKAITRSYLGPKIDADELQIVLDDIDERFAPTDDELGGGLMIDAEGAAAEGALNGIQVRVLLEVGAQVAAGTLPTDAAVILITQAYGWEEDVAQRFVEAARKGDPVDPQQFAQPPQAPPPQPPPATMPPPEPPA